MAALGRGAFSMMSNVLTVVKPAPIVAGVRGEPEIVYENVPSTNTLPVTQEIAIRVPDKVASELLQVFVPGTYDIVEGYSVTIDGKTYPISAASPWKLRDKAILMLILDASRIR